MTTVKLIAHTSHPVETIYCLWQASRRPQLFPLTPENLAKWRTEWMRRDRPEIYMPGYYTFLEAGYFPDGTLSVKDACDAMERDILDTWRRVVDAGIPVAENISLTFLLEGVSISLREQMVRHRIGHHFGDRLGVDIVPDLADSTWWAQTSRILDMSHFKYVKPAGITELGDEAQSIYEDAMRQAAEAYRALLDVGVTMEDARHVIPQGASQTISWTLNLAALRHVVGKRGCWIAQLGIWEPVVRGMVEEVARKIDPYLRTLIDPPCIQGGIFKRCPYVIENVRRVSGNDPIPPCPLFLHHHEAEAIAAAEAGEEGSEWIPGDSLGPGTVRPWHCQDQEKCNRAQKMAAGYRNLWRRDVHTGAPLDTTK